MKLRLLLQAPGSKYTDATRADGGLRRYFPPYYREYREPMCFAAGVFWTQSPHLRRWLNDVNPAVIDVWKRLRDDPAFTDEIMGLGTIPKEALRAEFYRRRELIRAPLSDPLSFVFVSHYAHLGLVRPKKRRDVAFPSYQRCSRVWRPRIRDLQLMRALLADTEITCGDYGPVLERPGRDTFLFIDPPYLIRHGLYDDQFSRRDFDLLAERLRECRHKWLMTVGDHPLIRDLFCGGRYRVIPRPYIGAEYRPGNGVHHMDLMVMNYDPPCGVAHAI